MNAMAKGRSVDELLRSVSASRIGTFQTCRLKFYFQYVEGLSIERSGARLVGSGVHQVLRKWNLGRWRKQPITLDLLKHELSRFLDAADVEWHADERKQHEDQAWALVQMYLSATPIPPNESAEGVEVSVEADLSSHGLTKLVGILDLVRPGGKIVDFKTAGQTPNPDKAVHLHETQLSVYGVLYRECTRKIESGFELHNLVKLKTPKLVVITAPTMTDQQRTRLYRQIESYLEGVRRRDWVPSPSPMACACCEFFNECRKWS
ncbi:MAG TPA: PD-(D/E)XK nuclease family protein [Candidatus Saccharimonadales bacterium]|nr:PD-(D/E)XK nuclease family protein [Candidatus Saccharimonadales bacterium]